MIYQGRHSVTIIGGGASGVLLAAHLLRDPETDIRVTLLERRGQFGQGVAYSASQREHKVNVPAMTCRPCRSMPPTYHSAPICPIS